MSLSSERPKSALHTIRLTTPLRRLVLMQAAMNTCHFIALPFLALALAANPNIGLSGAGFAIGTYLGVGRITPLLVGPLADRIGLWAMVCAGLAIRGGSLLIVPLTTHMQGAMLVAIALGVGVAAYETGIYGVMAAQPAKHREKLLMANVQALNLGCMVGPAIGFAVVLVAFDLAFILPGATLISLAIGCVWNRKPAYQHSSDAPVAANITRVLKDHSFLWMCFALIPFWALFAQLFGALPVLMAKAADSEAMAGLVIFLNGLVGFCAVFLYARLSERLKAPTLAMIGCGLGAVSTWLLGSWVGPILLIVLIGLFSIAETLVTTAADIITSRHADGAATGTYFSVLNVSIGIGSAIGAPLGMMAMSGDHNVSFTLIGMAGVLSAFLLMFLGSRGQRRVVITNEEL